MANDKNFRNVIHGSNCLLVIWFTGTMFDKSQKKCLNARNGGHLLELDLIYFENL